MSRFVEEQQRPRCSADDLEIENDVVGRQRPGLRVGRRVVQELQEVLERLGVPAPLVALAELFQLAPSSFARQRG
jgi:hypothetical protein